LVLAADAAIAGHQFGAFLVVLAMTLFLMACFRYRVVARVFEALGYLLGLRLRFPCYPTVRLWVLRLGLYRLRSVTFGPQWVLICDHTATYAGLKLFVVCAVDLEKHRQRIAAGIGDFNLCQDDLLPLALVPMGHSSGERLLDVYLGCIKQHGHPQQIITDGGSDILKSVALLQEHQRASQHPVTRHTYDISHQIARIMEAELAAATEWQAFEETVKAARNLCKYKLRHLSPPSQSHGPDRWMNLSGTVRWYSDMLVLVEKRETIAHQAKAEQQPPQQQEKPRIGLTASIWEAGKARHQNEAPHYNAIKSLCGKEYATEEDYAQAVEEKRPTLPVKIQDYLLENSDINEVYLQDLMEDAKQVRDIHQTVKDLLAFTNRVQQHLKTQGLSAKDVGVCEGMLQEAQLKGVGQRVGERVLTVIRDMAQDLAEDESIIVTSDVIESLNGSWKMLISGNPTPALAGNALLMPTLMGLPTEEEAKAALESVSVQDLADWTQATFGTTFHQEKLGIRPRKPRKLPPNPQEILAGV
jgi:hypothetical protein